MSCSPKNILGTKLILLSPRSGVHKCFLPLLRVSGCYCCVCALIWKTHGWDSVKGLYCLQYWNSTLDWDQICALSHELPALSLGKQRWNCFSVRWTHQQKVTKAEGSYCHHQIYFTLGPGRATCHCTIPKRHAEIAFLARDENKHFNRFFIRKKIDHKCQTISLLKYCVKSLLGLNYPSAFHSSAFTNRTRFLNYFWYLLACTYSDIVLLCNTNLEPAILKQ